MAYKVYQKLTEEGRWIPIIDVKKSKSKRVDRIFMSEDEAEYFINKIIKPENREWVKIVDVEEENEV